MARKPIQITKSQYHYKDKKGSFKPVYIHKYAREFKNTGRKTYIIYRKSKNYKGPPFYGRMYRKSEITGNINKKYSKKKIKTRKRNKSRRRRLYSSRRRLYSHIGGASEMTNIAEMSPATTTSPDEITPYPIIYEPAPGMNLEQFLLDHYHHSINRRIADEQLAFWDNEILHGVLLPWSDRSVVIFREWVRQNGPHLCQTPDNDMVDRCILHRNNGIGEEINWDDDFYIWLGRSAIGVEPN